MLFSPYKQYISLQKTLLMEGILNLDLSKFNLLEGDEYLSVYERRLNFKNYRNARDKKVMSAIKNFNTETEKTVKMSHKHLTKENILILTLKIYN